MQSSKNNQNWSWDFERDINFLLSKCHFLSLRKAYAMKEVLTVERLNLAFSRILTYSFRTFTWMFYWKGHVSIFTKRLRFYISSSVSKVGMLAEQFSIGKTTVWNILKEHKILRKDFEFLNETLKKCYHWKYYILNERLYNWYGKCTCSNIYPDGILLQEEALEIQIRLDKEELNDF